MELKDIEKPLCYGSESLEECNACYMAGRMLATMVSLKRCGVSSKDAGNILLEFLKDYVATKGIKNAMLLLRKVQGLKSECVIKIGKERLN